MLLTTLLAGALPHEAASLALAPTHGLAPSAIPSPEQGVWHLGGFPLRGYALCILAGIIVAVAWTSRRLQARGGLPGQALDISAWAVPFGIVGGRIYHVLTTPAPYFGEDGEPVRALFIWEGGLGIWGAVALGAVGAWLGCRRAGVSFRTFADAAAPAVPLAQAIGRWGNWFNNELYGRPTDLPWALTIHDWDQLAGRAVLDPDGNPVVLGTFHPTFLYESLWCLAVAAAVVLVERRTRLARGQAFLLYVMLYTVGRGFIETLRTDAATMVLGVRLNVWTSIAVFVVTAVIFAAVGRGRHTGSAGADGADGDGETGAQPAPGKQARPAPDAPPRVADSGDPATSRDLD